MQAPPFPPSNPYAAMPPPLPTGQQGNHPPPPIGGLPPNILALLQSAQRQTPPAPHYSVPPQIMNSPPPGPTGTSANQYQQLMSYLVIVDAIKCIFANDLISSRRTLESNDICE